MSNTIEELYQTNEELFRVSEELFRVNTELYQAYEELLQSNGALYRINDHLASKSAELAKERDNWSERVRETIREFSDVKNDEIDRLKKCLSSAVNVIAEKLKGIDEKDKTIDRLKQKLEDLS